MANCSKSERCLESTVIMNSVTLIRGKSQLMANKYISGINIMYFVLRDPDGEDEALILSAVSTNALLIP